MSEDDIELRRIRMEKIQQIMKAKQEAEAKAKQKSLTLADKIDMLIKVILEPSALQYLNQIKTRSVTAYNYIRSALFPDDIVAEIDILIQYLKQGMIRKGVISLTEIQYLERQALGIDSTITVKKQGEKAVSLSNFLKDDEK